MKKKKILKLIAASTIIVNCAGVMANAQTDKNVQGYNVATVETKAKDSVTLQSGKQIKVITNSKGEVEIQENDILNADVWTLVENIGKAEVKNIEENADGSYTVTYLKESFKYTRIYGSDSSKIQDEKMVGAEVFNYDYDVLTVDFSVDKSNCITTIKTPNGNVEVENFIPTLVENMGDRSISMLGKDNQDNTSAIVITDNKKVIQSKDIAKIIGDDYAQVIALSVTEVDEERFLILGSAAKKSNTSHKDGFIIQFDGQGERDSTPIKKIPASADNNYDASIKSAIKFDNGNLLLEGENLGTMYINALDYNDPRIVKESLKLASGKTYKVVEPQTMTLSTTKTYIVKCVDGDFEYDVETYEDVKDIKLVPGNDNQVLVAIQKESTTEIGVINSQNKVNFDEYGEAVNAVTKPVVINDNSGNPILNIDINTIKVEANGQVVLKKEGQSDVQQVTVQNVKEGDPVEVTTPEPEVPPVPTTPPATGGEEKPSEPSTQPPTVEDEKPSEPSTQPPTVEEEKPSEPSTQPPTVEEERPSEPSTQPPTVEEEKPGDNVAVKPENSNEVVNIDDGEKVIFNTAKPNNIKIVSSKLVDKEVSYIVVNGVKIIKPSMSRLAVNNTIVDYNDEYFTVSNGEITLLTKLFETLSLESGKGYDIGVGFVDGEEIESLTRISVMNGMNTVEKPVESSETTVTKPSENNSTVNTDKVVEKETSEKAPKTGTASGVSLMAGMISSAVGFVLSRKKK